MKKIFNKISEIFQRIFHQNLDLPKRPFSHCEINDLLNLSGLLCTLVHGRPFYGRNPKSSILQKITNEIKWLVLTQRCPRNRSWVPLLADLKRMKQRWAILAIAHTHPKRPHKRSDQVILRLILIWAQEGDRFHWRSVLLRSLGSHHTRSPSIPRGRNIKWSGLHRVRTAWWGNYRPKIQRLSSI